MMSQSLCGQTAFAIQTATAGLFIEVDLQGFHGAIAQRQTAGIEIGKYVLLRCMQIAQIGDFIHARCTQVSQ